MGRGCFPPDHPDERLTGGVNARTLGDMRAQTVESSPQRIVLPKKIGTVRAALTAAEREQFAEQLDDAEASALEEVVEYWWIRGLMNLSGSWEHIRAVESGTARVIPIEDVLPELRGRL